MQNSGQNAEQMSFYIKSAVMVAAILCVGLLAGLYVGTGLAQYSNLGTSYQTWIPRQQAEVGLFKTFMPSLGWAATLLPALAAAISSGARRWFYAVAALLILGTIISTMLGEIPLNKMIAEWDPRTPVEGWAAMRASWLHFHWIKTAMSVLAFAAATIGLSRR